MFIVADLVTLKSLFTDKEPMFQLGLSLGPITSTLLKEYISVWDKLEVTFDNRASSLIKLSSISLMSYSMHEDYFPHKND